ncbi:hypothetical protein ACH5RR_032412 [Cinchona calisaya]|uniref:Uncharacterized protein n=1 Tax=Cinchona calisaya TaxID=153742 RepID=A0ABD2YLI0_9GENT
MEGLLPMVYNTIRKSRTRRHYEYLGSDVAVTAAQSYNIADFYSNEYDDLKKTMTGQYAADDHEKNRIDDDFNNINGENIKGHHHRRYKSFHVDNRTAQSKKLVRFRSHRFFSCVTGA